MDPRRVLRALKPPVTMLVLLAFVAFAAMWGVDAVRAPIPPRPPEPCIVTSIGPKFRPEHAIVRVFNATETDGVAKRVASILRADQVRVIKIANAEALQDKTTIVGYAKDSPEVVLIRGFFTKVAVAPDQRVDHTVDVIIGKDFAGMRDKPKLSVNLPDETACLPQIEVVSSTE